MNRTLSTRLTRLLGAAALALGLAAGNASATDYTFLPPVSTSPMYVGFNHLTPSFLDNIQFTLGALGTIGGSGTPVNLSIGPLSILNLAFTGGTVYSGTIASPGSAVGSFVAQPGGAYTFTGSLTPFATYFAQLSGTTSGTAGGSYAFAIAAIPEPGQWLMLLAGVALLGVMVRRRA